MIPFPFSGFQRFLDKLRRALFPSPKVAVLDIVSSCNAFCPFCPRQFCDSPPQGIMNPEVFRRIVSGLKEFQTIQSVRLYAYGEPLLHPHFPDFVRILAQTGWTISLSTNLTNAEKQLEALMEVDRLQYSIEGWDKQSYERLRKGLSFEKTFQAVQLIDDLVIHRRRLGKKTPIRVIRLVATRKTDIQAFKTLWEPFVDRIEIDPLLPAIEWDATKTCFKRVFPPSLRDEMFPLVPRRFPITCREPFESITINSGGKVVLCCTDFSGELTFGDFRNLRKAWFSRKLWKIRAQFLSQHLTYCRECPVLLELPPEISCMPQ